MVQTFYVWRIYNLTKNVWIPLLIELVSAAGWNAFAHSHSPEFIFKVAVVQCVLVWHFGIAV